jgi:isopenicillin-N N-acyltransferase like protein
MSELVVGTRRATTIRPWRAGVMALAIVIMATIVAWFIYRKAVSYDMPDVIVEGALSNDHSGDGNALRFGDSTLQYRGGIAVLRTSGEPHQMGAAHGRLLASEIGHFVDAARPSIERIVDNSGFWGSTFHHMILDWRLRFLDDGLTDPDRRWLAGMVRGAGLGRQHVDYTSLVHAAAVIDVGAPSLRSAEADVHVLARTLSITVPLANDPTRLWLASQLALPGLDDGGATLRPIVTIAKPTGKLAWAGIGWPGMAGVVMGVNSAGLALTIHPVRSGDVRATRPAQSIPMLARAVLEQAHTIDEALAIINKGETLGAAAIVVVDGNLGQSAVIERTPDKTAANRQPAAVIGDTLENQAFATDPQNDRARRQLSSTMRVARALKLIKTPPADLGALAGILRDHHTPDEALRALGHRGTIADVAAVATVIIDARARMMWIADDTANGRMRGFDLRKDLGIDIGTAASGAPDLAADPEAESGARDRIRTARSALRDARNSMAEHDPLAASDDVARALALAPDLPECLELAAQVAAANGDSATAKGFAQRWLDTGADNPAGEERARAILAR